jgi:hypothetical protein
MHHEEIPEDWRFGREDQLMNLVVVASRHFEREVGVGSSRHKSSMR